MQAKESDASANGSRAGLTVDWKCFSSRARSERRRGCCCGSGPALGPACCATESPGRLQRARGAACAGGRRASAGRRYSAGWPWVAPPVGRRSVRRAGAAPAAPAAAGWLGRCWDAENRSCASAAGPWAARVAAPAKENRRRAACAGPTCRSLGRTKIDRLDLLHLFHTMYA